MEPAMCQGYFDSRKGATASAARAEAPGPPSFSRTAARSFSIWRRASVPSSSGRISARTRSAREVGLDQLRNDAPPRDEVHHRVIRDTDESSSQAIRPRREAVDDDHRRAQERRLHGCGAGGDDGRRGRGQRRMRAVVHDGDLAVPETAAHQGRVQRRRHRGHELQLGTRGGQRIDRGRDGRAGCARPPWGGFRAEGRRPAVPGPGRARVAARADPPPGARGSPAGGPRTSPAPPPRGRAAPRTGKMTSMRATVSRMSRCARAARPRAAARRNR